MNLTPLADRVLIRAIESDNNERPSGLIMVDSADNENTTRAEVIRTGLGRVHNGQRLPLEVKAGDKVLVPKYAGTEVKVGSEDLILIQEHDILAVEQ